MKLYTAKYDADRPSTKSVEVPLNSNFCVAVGVSYEGNEANLKQNEVVLKDATGNTIEASNTVADKYLVFDLNTNGGEGFDKYTVESTTDGMTVKELNFKKDYTLTSGKVTITEDLPPEWIGATLYVDPTFAANYDYSKNPFQVCCKKADNTERWGIITYFLDANGNTLAYIANITSGFTDKAQQFWIPQPDNTILKTDTWTIPPECKKIYANVSVPSSYTTAHIDYTYTERIDRQFDLIVNKSDLGEIEGYGDNYIMENTITLAGTYNDDTTFNYTIPVIND